VSLPRRHRFRANTDVDTLFRRLPAGTRFRLSPPGGADVFGADPVVTLTPRMADDSPLLAAALRAALPRVPSLPLSAAPGFPGGAVGVIPYESGVALEGLPRAASRPDGEANGAWFGVYDTFARVHPDAAEVEVVSWGLLGDGAFDEREALRRARDLEELLRSASSGEPAPGGATPGPGVAPGGTEAHCSLDQEAHARAIDRIHEHIRRGDIYQANLTARFDVATDMAPLDLHERLRRDNPAPLATYLETDNGTVVSCSPECLLAARGRELVSEPIKGTAARGADPDDDARRARALLASAKDRAELLMITDLVRNDLGKVCVPGSVRVPHLARVRSFPHLHHLVATVRGTLPAGCDALDALAALFPYGSVTGAPKRRAMEILRELEPVPRGVYTGAVGWIGFDRSAAFAVGIRTGRHAGGIFSFGAGGGIVIDSRPADEWRELQLKARAFLLALGVGVPAATEGSA